jgi:hypothetical protein
MKILVIVMALLVSAVASAQSRIVSVDAFDFSYVGGFVFGSQKGAKGASDRDETTFKLNLNYAQNIPQYVGLMWKGAFYFNRQDVDWGTDSLQSAFGFKAGIIYNFQAEDVKNSIFLGSMVGIERATIEANGQDDESGMNLMWDLEGGKRWDLGKWAVANIM